MANYYVSSVDYAAVAQFAINTAYTSGQIIRQLATPTVNSERCFRCTTPGTTAGSEPSWTLTVNGTTTSGTATFTECTGQETYNSSWQAPAATTALYMAQTSGRSTASDYVFIRENHTETQTANQTWTASAQMVAAVASACAIPPVTADILTSPSVTIATSGATSISLSNYAEWSGIAFKLGTGASTANFNFGVFSGGGPMALKSCSVELVNTSASSVWNWSANSSSNTPAYLLDNVTFKVGNASQKISATTDCNVTWINTPSAIQGATIPTTLFSLTGNVMMTLDGVDLSALTTTFITLAAGSNKARVNGNASNCKLNSSVTVFGTTSQLLFYGSYFNFDNCSDTTNQRTFQMARAGSGGNGSAVVTDTQIARAGGASGVAAGSSVHYSWRSNISVGGQTTITRWAPWTSPWIAVYNTSTGSSKTLTISILSAYTTAPTNAVVWINVKGLTSSTSPLSEWFTTRCDLLPSTTPTTLTADTSSDWTAGTVATRANSTAYASGVYFKVSTAPAGMVFVSQGTTTSGSIPAAYTTAVDGQVIADGSGNVRALYRHSISKSFTPNFEGLMYLQVCLYDATTNAPIWVDPYITVT